MDMFLIANVLLVEMIHVNHLLSVGCPEELKKVSFELFRIIVEVLLWIFADEEHSPHV
jgi:hypothetical protein